MRNLLGTNDVLAYLTMMTARLIELHRALKANGSLYLHCDPTASHYLKVILDAIFGPEQFRNEIAWKRFSAKNDPNRYGRGHDVIFFYTKGKTFTWHPEYGPFEEDYVEQNYRYMEEGTERHYRLSDLTANKPGGDVDYEWHGMRPYKGRHWAYSRENMDKFLAEDRIVFRRTGMPVYKRYLDEMPGVPMQDIWTDIRLHAGSNERLGYPTQKPLALLERIIAASSNEGDVVLDPFCGCGTAVDAAQKLRRDWVGIDVTYLAIDLIRKRMRNTYGDKIEDTYEVHGIPADVDGARALFQENAFDFERWAVSLLDGQPNEKQVGDKGVDGVIRFYADDQRIGRAIISVKGGGTNPNDVSALLGVIQKEGAELGVFVMLGNPTKGMREVVAKSGTYESEFTGQSYPRVQIVTIADLMAGRRPKLPTAILPYVKAKPRARDQQALDL